MPRHTDSRERLLAVASELIWKHSYYGTSVDDICERCKIKKGSFYHHFPSKEALVIAALDHAWLEFKGFLDEAFSATHAPLERFRLYSRGTVSSQAALFKEYGKVLGCPLYSLGTEIGTQEPTLRAKIDAQLQLLSRYFSSTIREAQQRGDLPDGDPDALAFQLLSFSEGSLSHARIRNDLAPLLHLEAGMLRLLGARTPAAA